MITVFWMFFMGNEKFSIKIGNFSVVQDTRNTSIVARPIACFSR